MTRTLSEESIDRLLEKVSIAVDGRLLAYSVCFENMGPGDGPSEDWVDIDEDEKSVLNAAVRMGLVVEAYQEWTSDFDEEYVPHGGDFVVTLSGAGIERLLSKSKPLHKKWAEQISHNLPTIFVSVATALIIAWCTKTLGLK